MYSNDQPPPHFHARYAEYDAKIEIATGDLLAGQLRFIREWGDLHRDELLAGWELAQARKTLAEIEPLP